MSTQNDLHQKVAQKLVQPFSRARGRGSAPLAYRLLVEGGMVVITSDGRKLWFTADEVSKVMEDLAPGTGEEQKETVKNTSRFKPTGLLREGDKPSAYNGLPALVVLPPSQKTNDPNGEHRKCSG